MSRQQLPLQTKTLPCYHPWMVKPERLRPFQDIADRLRAAREVHDPNMDQKTFAEGAGLKHSQYKNWESGAYRIGLDGALALRAHYGLTLEYIYIGDVDSLPMSWRKELSSRLSVRS